MPFHIPYYNSTSTKDAQSSKRTASIAHTVQPRDAEVQCWTLLVTLRASAVWWIEGETQVQVYT